MISLYELKKVEEMQDINVNNNTDKNKNILEEEAKNNNNVIKEEKKKVIMKIMKISVFQIRRN